MPEKGWWSHAFDLETGMNVSKPESDVYYSLNVLLGLSQLPSTPDGLPWNTIETFERCCQELPKLPVPVYAYGMALWAGVMLNHEVPGATLDSLRGLLNNRDAWKTWRAQDVGLLLSGVSQLAVQEPEPWAQYAHQLYAFARDKFANTGTGLFLNNVNRQRGRFATFATGVYMTLGHFHYGEAFEDKAAIARAMSAVDLLAQHQGALGEWPWYYDALSGRVLDPYAVYSVHQDGMAPSYLHLAKKHGRTDAAEQIERGFHWILGRNQLGMSMLDGRRGLILRCQYRNETGERFRRAGRAVLRAAAGRSGGYVAPDRLAPLQECRSYHLGWVLWSFAGRDEYAALTSHPAIVDALAQGS